MKEKKPIRKSISDEWGEVNATHQEKEDKITGEIKSHARLPHEFLTYLFSLAFVAFGVCCIVITDRIQLAFPYIVGCLMILFGVYHVVLAFLRENHMTDHGQTVTYAVVFALLGAMILWEDHDWDMTFISIIWGVYGLSEGSRSVYRAVENGRKKKPFVFYLLKGILALILAFFLLHDMNIRLHIIIFGADLIFDGIMMLPFVRRIRYRI